MGPRRRPCILSMQRSSGCTLSPRWPSVQTPFKENSGGCLYPRFVTTGEGGKQLNWELGFHAPPPQRGIASTSAQMLQKSPAPSSNHKQDPDILKLLWLSQQLPHTGHFSVASFADAPPSHIALSYKVKPRELHHPQKTRTAPSLGCTRKFCHTEVMTRVTDQRQCRTSLSLSASKQTEDSLWCLILAQLRYHRPDAAHYHSTPHRTHSGTQSKAFSVWSALGAQVQ